MQFIVFFLTQYPILDRRGRGPSPSFLLFLALHATLALVQAVPWPVNDTYPYPGAPDLIEGAWVSTSLSALPLVGITYNSQLLLQRLTSLGVDGSGTFFTSWINVTSYICDDTNAFRYTSSARYNDNTTVIIGCGAVYVNETHAIYSTNLKTDGMCPDAASVEGDQHLVLHPDVTARISTIILQRVPGVMPGKPVLTCVNKTGTGTGPVVPYPPLSSTDTNTTTNMSNGSGNAAQALPLSGGPPPSQGVWKEAGAIGIDTSAVYAGAYLDTSLSLRPGEKYPLAGFSGVYVGGHACINATAYVAMANETTEYFTWAMESSVGCRVGDRTTPETLTVLHLNETDCSQAADGNVLSVALREDLKLIRPVSTTLAAKELVCTANSSTSPAGPGPGPALAPTSSVTRLLFSYYYQYIAFAAVAVFFL